MLRCIDDIMKKNNQSAQSMYKISCVPSLNKIKSNETFEFHSTNHRFYLAEAMEVKCVM